MSYCKRVWLNKPDCRATGSVVAYAGDNCWKDEEGNLTKQYVLEISDCHGKIALHKSDRDTIPDFIEKLELLSDTINGFIRYLESENG
jgi:hypothetical protein